MNAVAAQARLQTVGCLDHEWQTEFHPIAAWGNHQRCSKCRQTRTLIDRRIVMNIQPNQQPEQ